jgi:hypothetical protein
MVQNQPSEFPDDFPLRVRKQQGFIGPRLWAFLFTVSEDQFLQGINYAYLVDCYLATLKHMMKRIGQIVHSVVSALIMSQLGLGRGSEVGD